MVIPILLYLLFVSKMKSKSSTTQIGQKKSGSWVVERDALTQYGDRKTRAILAVFTARRSSKKKEFFVSPHIARHFNLSARDLYWALDKLEGELVRTLDSKTGKFRLLSLMPEWELLEGMKPKVATGSGHAEDGELLVVDKERELKQLPISIDDEVAATLCELAKEVEKGDGPNPPS